MKKTIRIAGAQIPVTPNIQFNKKEIFKAIDWAKENEVDHLLTPEGALSGYGSSWVKRVDEIVSTLKEVEDYIKLTGVSLHLGTYFKEPNQYGIFNRNQIRHYDTKGVLVAITCKTLTTPDDMCIIGDEYVLHENIFPLEYEHRPISSCGLICNDMWGGDGYNKRSIPDDLVRANIDLIFHATNGRKFSPNDKRNPTFDAFHKGYLRMTALKTMSTILTVDSCVPWQWDPDLQPEMLDYYPTSSPSGVVDMFGWLKEVPRHGRHYFYHDLDVSISGSEKFNQYDREVKDKPAEYFSPLSNHQEWSQDYYNLPE